MGALRVSRAVVSHAAYCAVCRAMDASGTHSRITGAKHSTLTEQ